MALSFYTNWPNYDITYSSLFQDPTFYETEINPIFDTNFTNNLDPIPSIMSTQPEFLQCPYNYYNSTTFDQGNLNVATLPAWCDYNVEKSNINNVQVKKQENGGLSAQSIAARLRRRKISEKTAELGKLIPGGYKMNTAEMFQAAYKYIKFLQAQIGVLKFMASIPVIIHLYTHTFVIHF